MKADQAKKMTDDAIANLIAALEAGKSEALVQYLGAMAKFHAYSWHNAMLIAMQCPHATHVAGFRTWKQLGRWVKKGEKGIAIMAPMVVKLRDEPSDDQTEMRSSTGLRFRVVYVFDITQTDGEPLPEPKSVHGDPGEYSMRLRSFIESKGIRLVFGDLPGGVLGASAGGTITVRRELPAAEEFAVLAHELAHEMLHHGEAAERGSKSRRETEAEAVAFIVTHAVGLETGTAASDYIQLYSGDKQMLLESLSRVQQTAQAILAGVLGDAAQETAGGE